MTDHERLLACTTALLAEPRPSDDAVLDLLASLVISWCGRCRHPNASLHVFKNLLRDFGQR